MMRLTRQPPTSWRSQTYCNCLSRQFKERGWRRNSLFTRWRIVHLSLRIGAPGSAQPLKHIPKSSNPYRFCRRGMYTRCSGER